MRPVDADNLYEKACDLEAQALSYVGKVGNDESKIEEWKIWSAILTERTAFKHDVYDAPTIEPGPQWVPCSERLPEGKGRYLVYYTLNGTDRSIRTSTFYPGGWLEWDVDGTLGIAHVFAWMTLPEPYREGKNT